ncbi:DUF262 domain-containing protein [Tsukamurella soli]|uniref:GmrSD restriction endonucleases N-terminal domain-containing protein n=1 Tax=Tsukamurella soli TaxID=644556 RepID=A0ABP8J112_9ACTN
MTTASNPTTDIQLIDAVDGKVSAIRTRQLDLSFNELADMYKSGELIIQPEYQRLFRWTPGAQSRFIETLILELPVPPIFLMETEENVYELIDGLQRISSYLNFRGLLPNREPLKLEDCDIVEELNGHTYTSLPAALERRLKRNFIRAEILRKESDVRLRYYMFKRLNSGGEPLEQQEIRNCTIRLLSPHFNDLLRRLAKTPSFEYCISIISDSQLERRFNEELTLRFFAFLKWNAKYKKAVGDFLTEYMEAASAPEGVGADVFDMGSDLDTFEKTFATLKRAAELDSRVGTSLFGSVNTRGTIIGQFAIYHYEGIALGLQRVLHKLDVSDDQQMRVLGAAIFDAKTDPDLRAFTGGGKNTAQQHRDRIEFFGSRFESAL